MLQQLKLKTFIWLKLKSWMNSVDERRVEILLMKHRSILILIFMKYAELISKLLICFIRLEYRLVILILFLLTWCFLFFQNDVVWTRCGRIWRAKDRSCFRSVSLSLPVSFKLGVRVCSLIFLYYCTDLHSSGLAIFERNVNASSSLTITSFLFVHSWINSATAGVRLLKQLLC